MTTATATVLFCDVVSSTEHRARLGEVDADRFFREIEQLLRDEVERTNGRVVKGAGDGIMAVFTAASDAAAGAIALHQGVRRSAPELQLRVGVAAGDVSWEGDDCFGMPVVVAARLESACDPGGILVSAIVRHLAGDRADADYEPYGELDLKGVPSPVDTFSISWQLVTTDATDWQFPTSLPRGADRPFVGRNSELSTMLSAWNAAVGGDDGVLLLGGEVGAGKTRLATELARRCHSDGAIVVCGLCDSELSLPYQPWVMALDELISQLPRSTLDDLRDDLAHLKSLVPAIERIVGGLPRTESLDPEAERHRMFGSVAAVLQAASALAPLLIIVDDLHWGGRQTLELFNFLVRTGAGGRSLIVSTFRDTSDEISDPLAKTLAELRRVESVTRVKVGGIDSDAVYEMLSALDVDGDLRARAETITQRTRGNAFLVSELLLHSASDAVPDGVLDVVEARLLPLGSGARALANLVAVAGRIELNVLIETTRSSGPLGDDFGAALGELTSAGLVQEIGGGVPAYQFAHALIRDAVSSKLSSFERSTLHHTLANAIEAVHETDRRLVLAELTRHYAAASAIAGWKKTAYYGRRAAAHARRSAAYEEAIELISTSLDVTPAGTEERALLLIDMVDLLERCGRNPDAVTLAAEADDEAFEIGDLVLQARASIELERAAHLANTSLGTSIPRLRRVVEQRDLLTPSLHAMAMGSLGRAAWLTGRPEGADLSAEALRLSHELGDADAISHALEVACVIEADPQRALELARELERVTEANRNIFRLMWAMTRQTDALITLGRLADAEEVLERLRWHSDRYRFTNYRYLSYMFTHTLALAAGDFETAEAAAESANTDRQDEFAGVEASGAYGLQMFMVRRAQGLLEEMRPVLELVARNSGGGAVWRPGLVVAYAELQMTDDAIAGFDELIADECAALPRDTLWPLTLLFLADTCVLLDRLDAAPFLLAELAPFGGRTVRAGYTTNGGPTDRCRAMLAETIGQEDLADELAHDAVDLAHASGSPVWRAETDATLEWIRAHRKNSSVKPPNSQARTMAHRHESTSAETLRADDARNDNATQRAPDDLSPREAEVLAELALGHTNRVIADRLFISPNTAANHVRAILRKTGCQNRTEAAAYAVRNGLGASTTDS